MKTFWKTSFISLMISLCVVLFISGACSEQGSTSDSVKTVSGAIVDGYRVIEVNPQDKALFVTVFRGDYVKFKADGSLLGRRVEIPELNLDMQIVKDIDKAPFFKMEAHGDFILRIGDIQGTIKVVGYLESNYHELSASETRDLINKDKPVLLDVRTRPEYKNGHIADSVLIPVQEIQSRLSELTQYKEEKIILYCASGNRSTVASKILIDQGFRQIYNLKGGIKDWARQGYPVVR